MMSGLRKPGTGTVTEISGEDHQYAHEEEVDGEQVPEEYDAAYEWIEDDEQGEYQ